MNGRPITTDPNAASAKTGLPAFLARPPGAPVYHGFQVVRESETDGWVYGAITAFEGVGTQHAGDGFVIAPDGSRAGIVWSNAGPEFGEVLPPDGERWGVYSIRFPRAVNSRADLIENFRAVLPLLRERFAVIRTKNR